MRRFVFIAALAVAALTAGCAGAFKQPNYAPADWGPEPTGYEDAIKTGFEGVLKDAESARYKFGKPVRAYKHLPILKGAGIEWVGYLVPVQVNSKNGFGAYAGFTDYQVLLNHRGGVYSIISGSSHPLVTVMPSY